MILYLSQYSSRKMDQEANGTEAALWYCMGAPQLQLNLHCHWLDTLIKLNVLSLLCIDCYEMYHVSYWLDYADMEK